MRKSGIIYIIKNNLNNKYYVGQTIRPLKNRIYAHKYYEDSLIGRVLNKYEKKDFTIYSISGIPIEYLNWFEIKMISKIKSISPRGYNLTCRGNCNSGGLTEEHKRKIGIKSRGRIVSLETRKILSKKATGRKSPLKGISLSTKTKNKISENTKGRIPWNREIPMSIKAKKKASLRLKNRKPTNNKSVICIETNEKFESIRKGARKYNIQETNLASHIRGNLKSCGGMHWREVS